MTEEVTVPLARLRAPIAKDSQGHEVPSLDRGHSWGAVSLIWASESAQNKLGGASSFLISFFFKKKK